MLNPKYNIQIIVYRKILNRNFASISYKNSLNLPRTQFPHKIHFKDRRNCDVKIEKFANFGDLYNIQQKRNRDQKFILHDGPPYANGDVHIGHAVNKILKDITNRHFLLKGRKVCFMPGWDCHGLPIELKVLKERHKLKSTISPLDIRIKGHSFSAEVIKKQKSSFMKWGILADWNNHYMTCNKEYVIQQLSVFQDLYEKGFIFRDYKPVFWSPENKTSLAEAELEYNSEHISRSVFVKFPVCKGPESIMTNLKPCSNLHIVIWTTTPWSLPANQAVCYNPQKTYCIVFCDARKEYYVLAQEMISSLNEIFKSNLKVVSTIEGSLLQHVTYRHPTSKERECPVLPSHHVTMDKGTGLVHTAPNHGVDDYAVAKHQSLIIDPCVVDEAGRYNAHAPPALRGQAVLDEGVRSVLEMLGEEVLVAEDLVHSYPYDWRSKTPVLVRSCHQWFIDVDRIRARAMDCLKNVTVIPDHYKKVFLHQLQSSPHWCISRQRAWGVPIPAFYSTGSDKPVVHKALTSHLCSLIRQHGIHAWWEKEVDELIPDSVKNELNSEHGKLSKSSDIMDIWFDSGISWKCVLPEPNVSDMCIEGIDQIRGWFNSSLLSSVAVRGEAPYKTLVLHGFTTDAEGRKMSKSKGNVISPEDILSGSKSLGTPPYGIDVLRWWVAAHACQAENVSVKKEILEDCDLVVNKIRNVFKFLLGNLSDFSPECHLTSAVEMRSLDVYMLYKLQDFFQKIQNQYDSVQYKSVTKEVLSFVTNEVSSFYCQLTKDRLYCDAERSKNRLDCQTVLYFTLNTLVRSVGPICPHLAEEVFSSFSHQNGSLFMYSWPNLNDFLRGAAFPVYLEWANQIREVVLKSELRTNEMEAIITCDSTVAGTLLKMNEKCDTNSGLNEFLQVSNITFNEISEISAESSTTLTGTLNTVESERKADFKVALVKTNLEKCPRCRLYASTSQTSLCPRCTNVIHSFSSEKSSVCT